MAKQDMPYLYKKIMILLWDNNVRDVDKMDRKDVINLLGKKYRISKKDLKMTMMELKNYDDRIRFI